MIRLLDCNRRARSSALSRRKSLHPAPSRTFIWQCNSFVFDVLVAADDSPVREETTMENRISVLIALLAEESTQLRFRSQGEHLYTAACLGAYGAFAWGVAALRYEDFLSRPLWMRPAFLAAFAIGISAFYSAP